MFSHVEFPESGYKNDISCSWTIRSKNDKQVKIVFWFFDLEEAAVIENEATCLDYLKIDDGYSGASQEIGKYCGNKVSTFVLGTIFLKNASFITAVVTKRYLFTLWQKLIPKPNTFSIATNFSTAKSFYLKDVRTIRCYTKVVCNYQFR